MPSHDIYLFMDANIYLKFYSYSAVDLETLSKIAHELNDKHFKIVITSHLQDEFYRNRDGYIKETINENYTVNLKPKFPTLISNNSKDHKKFEKSLNELKKASRDFNTICKKIINSIKQEGINNNLKPDILIKSIFDKAKIIKLNKTIYNQSLLRMRLKNPPGKPNEIGDRIHWESLLDEIEENCKLIIISEDSDFSSVIDKDHLNSFLCSEWRKKKKKCSIEFFNNLPDFLKKYLPQFELKEQLEISQNIRSLIESLQDSRTFSNTHYLIYQLNQFYNSFTYEDINDIVDCYMTNNQIYAIVEDEDIYDFLIKLTQHPNYNPDLDEHIDNILE